MSSRRLAWRCREREWSALALATVVLCGVFSLWPDLDLQVALRFSDGQGGWPAQDAILVQALYGAVPWLGRGLALAALLLALWPRRRLSARWRRTRRPLAAVGLSLLLAVGLVVNGGLKEHWGRARPAAVVNGADYSPAMRPVSQCDRNCSFVSGHAATGFALMAVGLTGPPAMRRRWWWVGMASGSLVGAGRILQGGHFLSDVLFAGLVVWACQLVLREVWLRAAARRRRRGRSGSQVPAAAHGLGGVDGRGV